jgi:hypothetical protein
MLVNSCAHFMFVMSWPFTVLTESPLIQLATLYILSEACTFIAEGSIYMIYLVSFVITLRLVAINARTGICCCSN